jgi:hypothetical protein
VHECRIEPKNKNLCKGSRASHGSKSRVGDSDLDPRESRGGGETRWLTVAGGESYSSGLSK